MSVPPKLDASVAQVLASYPQSIREKVLVLRSLIFKTAATTEGVGELTETLKWGEPAYLTTASKSGTTIRLGWKRPHPSRYAMYVHCQTNLVETFRTLAPDGVQFEGNRAIVFEETDTVPTDFLTACIAAALTYHREKRSARKT